MWITFNKKPIPNPTNLPCEETHSARFLPAVRVRGARSQDARRGAVQLDRVGREAAPDAKAERAGLQLRKLAKGPKGEGKPEIAELGG